MAKTIYKSVELNAKPEFVWVALTNPDLTELYLFGGRVESNWQTGGSIEWVGNENEQLVLYASGKIDEIEIAYKLTYTTTDGLTTKYLLEPKKNESTRLTIEQADYDKLENSQKRYDNAIVAWDSCLSNLSKLFIQI